ncbi:MAG: hypothetical protein EOP04_19775 [Proteobacteria bacterium]|nr:MAG: hypothetical protein EOP04_19775 [Pseudomonadota bacterium]
MANFRQFNQSGTIEHTAQVDYVHPLGNHTAEAGVKTIIRKSDSDYFYGIKDPGNDLLVLDSALTNQFDYRQDIYAAYGSVSFVRH